MKWVGASIKKLYYCSLIWIADFLEIYSHQHQETYVPRHYNQTLVVRVPQIVGGKY